ncbi:hypothetical protein CYMTET_7399 [Cymbomonas tetramitiformis]|uniref:Endonuclease/exonuclease/phosphatase domain-containing protein n=1 Tax=Cymbomonas tetramitiformis TaxID=36881 RepID=A0AAE0GV33_9CHLO|nr:hypothetical protein CYMTET_7399 [Cymbomonas tetramitiformis]
MQGLFDTFMKTKERETGGKQRWSGKYSHKGEEKCGAPALAGTSAGAEGKDMQGKEEDIGEENPPQPVVDKQEQGTNSKDTRQTERQQTMDRTMCKNRRQATLLESIQGTGSKEPESKAGAEGAKGTDQMEWVTPCKTTTVKVNKNKADKWHELRILTWNIRGQGDSVYDVMPVLEREGIEVTILTEVKNAWKTIRAQTTGTPMKSIQSVVEDGEQRRGAERKGYRGGVTVLLGGAYSEEHNHTEVKLGELQGYLVHTIIHLPGRKHVHLLAVYYPPEQEEKHTREGIIAYIGRMHERVQHNDNEMLIVGGDLNADGTKGTQNRGKQWRQLQQLTGMVDVGGTRDTTLKWHDSRNIDRLLTKAHHESLCEGHCGQEFTEHLSDHRMVCATMVQLGRWGTHKPEVRPMEKEDQMRLQLPLNDAQTARLREHLDSSYTLEQESKLEGLLRKVQTEQGGREAINEAGGWVADVLKGMQSTAVNLQELPTTMYKWTEKKPFYLPKTIRRKRNHHIAKAESHRKAMQEHKKADTRLNAETWEWVEEQKAGRRQEMKHASECITHHQEKLKARKDEKVRETYWKNIKKYHKMIYKTEMNNGNASTNTIQAIEDPCGELQTEGDKVAQAMADHMAWSKPYHMSRKDTNLATTPPWLDEKQREYIKQDTLERPSKSAESMGMVVDRPLYNLMGVETHLRELAKPKLLIMTQLKGAERTLTNAEMEGTTRANKYARKMDSEYRDGMEEPQPEGRVGTVQVPTEKGGRKATKPINFTKMLALFHAYPMLSLLTTADGSTALPITTIGGDRIYTEQHKKKIKEGMMQLYPYICEHQPEDIHKPGAHWVSSRNRKLKAEYIQHKKGPIQDHTVDVSTLRTVQQEDWPSEIQKLHDEGKTVREILQILSPYALAGTPKHFKLTWIQWTEEECRRIGIDTDEDNEEKEVTKGTRMTMKRTWGEEKKWIDTEDPMEKGMAEGNDVGISVVRLLTRRQCLINPTDPDTVVQQYRVLWNTREGTRETWSEESTIRHYMRATGDAQREMWDKLLQGMQDTNDSKKQDRGCREQLAGRPRNTHRHWPKVKWLEVNIKECNPNHDIKKAKGGTQIRTENGTAYCYARDGSLIGMIWETKLRELYNRYMNTVGDEREGELTETQSTARHNLHKDHDIKVEQFEDEIALLLKRYSSKEQMKLRRKHLQNHWTLPGELMEATRVGLGVDTELFASPLNVHTNTRKYYSRYPRDMIFGARGSAWDADWQLLGAYQFNPEYTAEDLHKALEKAVAATDSHEPKDGEGTSQKSDNPGGNTDCSKNMSQENGQSTGGSDTYKGKKVDKMQTTGNKGVKATHNQTGSTSQEK